jgi:hypothetical protein
MRPCAERLSAWGCQQDHLHYRENVTGPGSGRAANGGLGPGCQSWCREGDFVSTKHWWRLGDRVICADARHWHRVPGYLEWRRVDQPCFR